MAREMNGWKPTPVTLLLDIEKARVEHGHGGLWNGTYDIIDTVCIDMKACYPASFQGLGKAKPYFERFGHPTDRMTRVSINGDLPKDIDTDRGIATFKIREATITFKKQTEVCLPEDRNQGCSIIGKFIQGRKADCKIMTSRLVTDKGELDFLVKDTRENEQRFKPDEAVRVATDSTYVKITALHKLENTSAHVSKVATCECNNEECFNRRHEFKHLPYVAPAQWRDKGETLRMPTKHANYLPKPEYKAQVKYLPLSTQPNHDDKPTHYSLSYLNGQTWWRR
ncbi:hypothetical protein CAPTEDRAFT_209508 [Capitella teleta]|uniref:Uncharacterized protein n=1 Tax=Capitella teleta TaxID=283909 RepID=R7TEY8_CAPTE|nr:hypothetical protein CAPTEDRAFT_209508 [Capitella teleta]|eukprot:ELT92298.1 hypothetical protein CAPTEDRAFT_209508 [Capitella teleta]